LLLSLPLLKEDIALRFCHRDLGMRSGPGVIIVIIRKYNQMPCDIISQVIEYVSTSDHYHCPSQNKSFAIVITENGKK